MKSTAILAVVGLCGLLAPTTGHAQRSVSVSVIPRVGLVAPGSYFYEYFANLTGEGPVEWTTGSLGRALVAGLGAELRLGDRGVLIRGEVLRSIDGWLLAAHSIVAPGQFFNPPQVVNTWLDVPYTVTMTSLQVVLPTKLELWNVQPYVLAGVAGKLYGFGESTRPNHVEATLPTDGFTWGGDLGAGATVLVLGLTLDLQVRDTINRYWGTTQNDLVYSSGLVWSVW